jgi:hypothetical protein
MPLPAPAPGLVIGYPYLWHDEHLFGAEEGRKDRPCAIVLAATDDEGDMVVYVVPITHRQPQDVRAVAMPASVKRRLGLDDAPFWIVTSELNRFVWPGYDLRPIARDRPDTFAWGFLPTEIFDAVKRGVAANRTAGRLKSARR